MNPLCRRILLLAVLVVSMLEGTNAQPNYPTDPENAQLLYSDLENFVETFEALKKDRDTIAVLNQYYFDRGSAGLKEYIIKQQLTPELMKEAIAKDPISYGKLSEFLAQIPAFEPEYKEIMRQFQQVLPSAMYAPTYLLVGANRGIAQASKVGQLVTVTKVIEKKDKLKQLIIHETAHFQQAITMGIQEYGALYGKPNNMLGICLREGGAEFITYLVLSQITQTKGLEYFQENEAALKSRFIQDLKVQDPGYWLWDSLEDPNTPNLLGYVMGYKIWEAYFDRATDKSKALQELLLAEKPEEIVQISGYFPK